ncbi:putative replication factor A2 [Histomonas meleagridis]|uniref:putative replication factor A2 n=1 Tax=Histomonas meleagridis TaxID=135588 RepID=UPI0035594589|nr:putative replication factor A2 [Histomonas meleagridis]KAH0804669.1 putative replication factor A2 [Histomonas meleagridis]
MEGGFDLNDKLPSESNERLPVNVDDSITPVTIKQLLNSNYNPGQPFLIDGVQRKQINIVGMVHSVQEEAIASYYEIDDSTGIFQVQDFSKNMECLTLSFPVGTYVSVVGKISTNSQNTGPIISAFSVKQVEDFDEIPYHFLHALFVHFFSLRGLPPNSSFAIAENPRNHTEASDHNEIPAPQEQENNQEMDEQLRPKILEYIQIHNSSTGVSKAEIAGHFGSTYSLERISNAISALEYNGEIYSPSIDHYVFC